MLLTYVKVKNPQEKKVITQTTKYEKKKTTCVSIKMKNSSQLNCFLSVLMKPVMWVLSANLVNGYTYLLFLFFPRWPMDGQGLVS
jgi:hypothetical protein